MDETPDGPATPSEARPPGEEAPVAAPPDVETIAPETIAPGTTTPGTTTPGTPTPGTTAPETARPMPFPVHPAVLAQPRPEPAPRRTRRWVLAGAAALVVGGGAGVATDFVRGRPRPARPAALPNALRAALADERALLASARAAHGLASGTRETLVRDHEAHLEALIAAAAGYAAPKRGATPVLRTNGTDRASLARLESLAAQRASSHGTQLVGDTAALLASISACESTHVELLT